MHRLVFTGALLAICASAAAQLTYPVAPGQSPGIQARPGAVAPDYDLDVANWEGPLAVVANEPSVYRTFAAGSLSGARNEISPNAVLTGFELHMMPSGTVMQIHSLKAFYHGAGGYLAGAGTGDVRGGKVQIHARPGYAVRFVKCGAASPLSGFQVMFAKLEANGTLSDTDQYASPAYGMVTRVLDGGGVPFCGIAVNGTAGVDGLALLVAQPLVQTLRPRLAPMPRGLVNSTLPGLATPGSQPANRGTAPVLPGMAPVPALESPTSIPALSRAFAGLGAASAAVSAFAEARVPELVREAGESLVFVESADGQGSGFTCNLNGKRLLVTNQHVIDGNPRVRFTTLSQAEVKTGPARVAAAHDVIVYEAPEAPGAFEVATDFLRTVSVGDEVVVLGNTEGARVIKPLIGKVIAVGPNLVEISSAFMPGNSGSPIIHIKTGKVIGVATYAIIRKVDSLTGAATPSVRRFGYRLDSVQNWQPVNWALYQAEAAATKKAAEFSGSILNLLTEIRAGQFIASRHTDSRLKPAVGQLQTLFTRRGMNQIDRAKLVQNFLGELRNAVQRDVNDLRGRLQYDYFQREVAEESKLRAEIHTGLGEAIQRLR